MNAHSIIANVSAVRRAGVGLALARGWARAVGVMLCVVPFFAWLDALRPLPGAVRVALVTGWAIALVVLAGRAVYAARRSWPRSLTASARRIERRASMPADRLAGAIGLSEATAPPGSLREALIARAIMRGSEAAQGLRWASIVKPERSSASRGAWMLLGCTAAVGAAVWAMPRVFAAAFPRFAEPLADHPAYSPTIFECSFEPEAPGVGEDIVVRVRTRGAQPAALRLKIDPGDGRGLITTPMSERTAQSEDGAREFSARLQDVRRPLRVCAEGETGRSAWMQVRPDPAPRIRRATLAVEWPAYTGRGVTRHEIGAPGTIEALSGSVLRMRIESNIVLEPRGVRLSPAPEQQPSAHAMGRTLEATWPVSKPGETTIEATPVSEAGVAARESVSAGVRIVSDQPPTLALMKPEWHGQEFAAPEGATLHLESVVSDDYGLRAYGLAWSRLDERGIWRDYGSVMRCRADRAPMLLLDAGDQVEFAPRLSLRSIGAAPGDVLLLSLLVMDTRTTPFGEPQTRAIGLIRMRIQGGGSCSQCESGAEEAWIQRDQAGERDSPGTSGGEPAPGGEPEDERAERNGEADAPWPSPSQRKKGQDPSDEADTSAASGEGESDAFAGIDDRDASVDAASPPRYGDFQGERITGAARNPAGESSGAAARRVPEAYREVVARYFSLVQTSLNPPTSDAKEADR